MTRKMRDEIEQVRVIDDKLMHVMSEFEDGDGDRAKSKALTKPKLHSLCQSLTVIAEEYKTLLHFVLNAENDIENDCSDEVAGKNDSASTDILQKVLDKVDSLQNEFDFFKQVVNTKHVVADKPIVNQESMVPVSERPKPKPRSRPIVLIVEEKEQGDRFTEMTWSQAVKGGKVSQKLTNVPVRNNKVSQKGKGVITFDSENEREKAQELLSEDYKVSLPEKILPKVQILHLDNFGKDEKSDLQRLIMEKNEIISDFVADGKVFDILFINERTKSAVVKVSPEIKEYLSKKRHLNIGMGSHRVKPHFHVLQCFKCQKFGHKSGSDQCALKDDNEKSVCLYCGEGHKSSECVFKKDKSHHKCSNCFLKGNELYNHTSNSNDCPLYQRALQIVKDNTSSLHNKNQGN